MARGETAKRPANALAGTYGHPIHPLLVTVPIGVWIASLVFDVTAFTTDSRSMAEGAYWLIGIGILGALVAAIWGLIDLMTIPRGTEAWRTGLSHMLLNAGVTLVFAVSFLVRMNDGYREIPSGMLLALSVVALAALTVSGWLGGRLSYRFGVRVASDQIQEEGFGGARQQGGMRRAA